MCVAAPVLAAWAAAASTAVAVGSAYQQSRFQGKIADRNVKIEDLKTTDAARRGDIAAQEQANKTRQLMGAQRAAIGASGAELDSGSGGKILEQTALYGALDEQRARVNASREAWGYQQEAVGQELQGTMARRAGLYNMGGGLLSGGSKAYGLFKEAYK